MRTWRSYCRQKKENSTYHNTLALVHYRAGNFSEAVVEANRSLKLGQAASAPFDWLILDLCQAQLKRQLDPASLGKEAWRDLVNAANTLRGKKPSTTNLKQAQAWFDREEKKAAQKKPVSAAYLQTYQMEIPWLLQELDSLTTPPNAVP